MAEILHAQVSHMANYSCKKVFPYDLKLSHNTFITDRQTNDNSYQ